MDCKAEHPLNAPRQIRSNETGKSVIDVQDLQLAKTFCSISVKVDGKEGIVVMDSQLKKEKAPIFFKDGGKFGIELS